MDSDRYTAGAQSEQLGALSGQYVLPVKDRNQPPPVSNSSKLRFTGWELPGR